MNKNNIIFCKCGCNSGIKLKFESYSDDTTISLVTDMFYSQQVSWHKRLGEKFKRILCILKNKEYTYFDIVCDRRELEEFKESIEKILNKN